MNFSGNKIRSLSGIEDHDLLETVDLEDNEVSLVQAHGPDLFNYEGVNGVY